MATPATTLYVGIPWEPETAESRAADRAAVLAEREARNAAIRAASPDGMTAVERAEALVRRTATQQVVFRVKGNARRYLANPGSLNQVAVGLADNFYADPRAGLRRLERVETVARFPAAPSFISLAAARLALRHTRRFAERALLLAAE
jgi:hypothetical protein